MTVFASKSAENDTEINVRERLLDVAEQLFADKGYNRTSIRQLAAGAKCNVASVNYYFGGKDKLYLEVWRRQLTQMRQIRLESIEKVMNQYNGNPPLDELLKSFAYAFLGPFVDESKSQRLMKLMNQEMLDRHLPLNVFIDEVVKPTMAAMGQAMVKACPNLDESKVPLLILSVIAQLVHMMHIKAMFAQADAADIPKLDLADAVEHIVKFSTAGIRAYIKD